MCGWQRALQRQHGADRQPPGLAAGPHRDDQAEPQVRRSRFSYLQYGVFGIVLVAIACYLVFGGGIPFTGPPVFRLNAIFTSETDQDRKSTRLNSSHANIS